MILTNLQNTARIEALHPRFKQLFDYVKSHDILHMECGRIELDGDNLFINNANPECMPAEKQVLEVHRDYIDVQILLEGRETMGWKALEDVTDEVKPYDPLCRSSHLVAASRAWPGGRLFPRGRPCPDYRRG